MKRVSTTVLGVSIIMLMMAAAAVTVVLDAARASVPPAPAAARPEPTPRLEHRALSLARAAAAAGYRELVLTPGTWESVQLGAAPEGYNLDSIYGDRPEGRYAVRLASGPQPGQVTIVGVAREDQSGLVRAVKVVYERFSDSSLREIECRWDGLAPRCP